ncbi:prepilin-type N-terminal cleavage/methylation domain-containing protein [bacterium]|nr:prepilin-type N-terminal cleavage/methylation domain-containing protein [bacterium]
MKKLLGFTLTELLVAMTVLGILCAAITPAVVSNMPNQHKILTKRAFYNTLHITKNLIESSILYNSFNEDTAEAYIGFENISSVTVGATEYSGESKLADLFILNLKKKGDVDDSTDNCSFADAATGCRTVTTTDGMVWKIGYPSTIIPAGTTGLAREKQVAAYILVDTNGDDKPNCYQGNTSDTCKERTKNFDQFIMQIFVNGQVYIDPTNTWALDVVDASTEISGND